MELPDPSHHAQWYGQIWIRYPLGQQLISLHFGHTFAASASYWTIVNDITRVALDATDGNGGLLHMSQVEVNRFYSRLTKWFDNLPAIMHPNNVAAPYHLNTL